MKYMIKEWYNNVQKGVKLGILKINKQKTKFSKKDVEEFFQIEKEKWLSYNLSYEKFENNYKNKIEQLKNDLPSSFIGEYDICSIALGYATKKVYKKITNYYNNLVKKVILDYTEEVERQFKNEKPLFYQESFHDSIIINCQMEQNDYILNLNNKHSLTHVKTIVFKNCEIIKQEGILKKATWLYEEIFKNNNKYEIHILFYKYGLKDFIIECSEIELKY